MTVVAPELTENPSPWQKEGQEGVSFGLLGGWSITIPLVWLLPILHTSSDKWVESGGVVNSLSDDLSVSPWQSVNSDLLSLTRGVVWFLGDDSCCDVRRSQFSTLLEWF